MGDLLLLRGVLASLRAAGHRVWLLAPSGSGSVLVGNDATEAEGLLAWDRAEVASLLSDDGVPSGPFRETLASFDVALAYTRSAALTHNLGRIIPRIVCHDPVPAPGSGHVTAWLAQPLGALGVAASEPRIHVPSAPESARAAEFARDLPERFLAIHPGSGSPSKNWPAERFAALVEARAGGRPWLLVEGPADEAAALPLRERPGAVHARDLSPRHLAALVARAGAYVGNDSGVSHLAAAWGAPTVALFGPTDPRVWSPVGPDVCVVRAASGRMADIDVQEVVAVLPPRPADH